MYKIEYAYVTEEFECFSGIVTFDTDDCDQAYELMDRWIATEIDANRWHRMIPNTLRLSSAN